MGDMPRRESIVFFENTIKRHSKVTNLKKIKEQVYEIYRESGRKLLVYLTNVYTVGIADYYDILDRYPNIDCIVTISNWNSYTRQAKEQAIENNVGIYVFEEFMGALNFDRHWEYVKKDSNGEPVRFWHG